MKVEVCGQDELPPGAMRGVALDEDRRVVVANVGGELRAFSGICTHAYSELDKGRLDAEEGTVMCFLHFAVFDTASGEALDGPAQEPLATYPVKVEAGKVFVEVPG